MTAPKTSKTTDKSKPAASKLIQYTGGSASVEAGGHTWQPGEVCKVSTNLFQNLIRHPDFNPPTKQTREQLREADK